MGDKNTSTQLNPKSILVVGGGGYIGSHICLDLKRLGFEPVVVDNFSTGNRDIAARLELPIFEGDCGDAPFIESVIEKTKPSAVMHFAAFAAVGESVTAPDKYYNNNVVQTIALLDAMKKHSVKQFIFSSTCATYGTPATVPISETTPQSPINPYGRSKLYVEGVLKDYDAAYGLKSVIFRYFNAAGADKSGLIGERHDPETHLIPLAIYAAQGKGNLTVFGTDYPTPDGTCIRDYIHVSDISQAHILGLRHLQGGRPSDIFNIGNGEGYSVKEVISTTEAITGLKVPHGFGQRREGDPPRLVADARKIREVLDWKPEYPRLDDIVSTAWKWHRTEEKVAA